ncbi:hypothetical protein [cf. Phormidesmis sp. LEGE 11477]|uniref:hypothetical protein n=1 Tax=cf. Phormidesmis sp. LEGE 11477 TaxID=1828680 RepID=UPI001880B2DD|nr:hypothetical protein [cf. Phormidesmis sp. LEGE 11477]MBE9063349.1 hypothetical protein [cf. Phormidesmis sp. LEGE 11477]
MHEQTDHEQTDIEAIRAEALRKLGRNIVNFSKIERGFKLLLSVSQISGTTTTLRENMIANQRRFHKQTLGQLVGSFNRDVLCSHRETKPPENLSELWLGLSFTVNASDPEQWKQTLAALVAERNHLIHHQLGDLDTTSVEDYRQLTDLLDEQNPRLLHRLDELRSMLEVLIGATQEIKKLPEWM